MYKSLFFLYLLIIGIEIAIERISLNDERKPKKVVNEMAFKSFISATCTCLMVISINTGAAPVVYTNEALYLSDLKSLGYSVISESFEDSIVWEASRNSITSPGSTPSVTSQGIVWTSNYTQNNIATGTVGGGAPDGSYAIYSLPHGMTTDSGLYCDSAEDPDIPVECYQNDGLKVESETGETLYAFGGRIETANGGKVSFLLDGTDINGNNSDNIDNWQRKGDLVDNWSFIGVIDTDGFVSAEIRELAGKDFQQIYLFADSFTIGAPAIVPAPAAVWLFGTGLIGLIGFARGKAHI